MKITILKDFSAELWKANRRKVVRNLYKSRKIDGIEPLTSMWTAKVNTNWIKGVKFY